MWHALAKLWRYLCGRDEELYLFQGYADAVVCEKGKSEIALQYLRACSEDWLTRYPGRIGVEIPMEFDEVLPDDVAARAACWYFAADCPYALQPPASYRDRLRFDEVEPGVWVVRFQS